MTGHDPQGRDFRPVLYSAVDKGRETGSDEAVEAFAPVLATMVAARVADALDAQGNFYWEASTLLDPARQVAEQNGEDAMMAVIDAQIRTMREVSTRLRRRAADWRGAAEPDSSWVAAPGVAEASAGLPSVAALADAWFAEHPQIDPAYTSLEFKKDDQGRWNVVGSFDVPQQPGFPLPPPAPPLEVCCECCSADDGLCYCEGPAKSWCKCKPCFQKRKDAK